VKVKRGRHIRFVKADRGVRWCFIVLLAATAFAAVVFNAAPASLSGTVYVADGDTLQLGRTRIRLLGIDAPELDQTCQAAAGEPWACGSKAKQFLRDLIHGQPVSCHAHGADKYGRVLATCRAGALDLNSEMVLAGLAISDSGYAQQEKFASKHKKGVFAGIFMDPALWRQTQGKNADIYNPWQMLLSLMPS
jgi:endonuclease YncB( thermonuclease family)